MAPDTATPTVTASGGVVFASDSENQVFANKCVSVRLDDDNFLLWKQQVLLLIRGHGLEDFLDSSTPVPPSTVVSDSGERIVNPLYTRFRKQDSSLASWLLSTISPSVLPQLVGAETSSAIWNTVLRLYSTLSTTKVMRLHCRLRSLKKGSLPMRAYISQIREICDLLATCGSKVSELEQVATILNGLSVEYEAFIAVITASREPYSLEAATDVLVDAEARMMDPMRTLVGINYTQQVSHRVLTDSTNRDASGQSDYRVQRTNNPSGGSRYQIKAPLASSTRSLDEGVPLFPLPVQDTNVFPAFDAAQAESVTPTEEVVVVQQHNSPCLPNQVVSTPVASRVLPFNTGLSDECPAPSCSGHSLQQQSTPVLQSFGQQQPCSLQQNGSQPAQTDSYVAPCEDAGNSSLELPVGVPAEIPNVATSLPKVANDNSHTMITRSKAGIFKPKAYQFSGSSFLHISFIFCTYFNIASTDQSRNQHLFEAGSIVISVEVLREVTDNFSEDNILGKGGFGVVYKGEMHDGTQIAVKRMERVDKGTKGMNEFQAEIAVLSKVRHRHLVALLGYCTNGNERLLVYEYMPQGTLSQHLFRWKRHEGGSPLTWMQRLTIALDVARGVEYLHSLAQQSFIHRDLKPSNILLGDDMRAKVADFGLVKNAPDGKHSLETRLAGTFGYLAPEYATTGRVTTKVDVYAFGVVLMELITGRKALDEALPDDQSHLVTWFRRMLINRDEIPKMFDETIKCDLGCETMASILKVAELAGHCTAREPSQRPDMGHAVNVLSPLVQQWEPTSQEEEEAVSIDLELSLSHALQSWEMTEGESSTFGDTSLYGTQTSTSARASEPRFM
ncbi:hypothetical protein GQ457_16G026700 [Hibiscus cannabinus]